MPDAPVYLASWSGGKDSCLALHRAILRGCRIASLVNFISPQDRIRFHGLNAALIRLQSEAMGIPLLQQTTADCDYAAGFKQGVRSLFPVDGMIFGDIYIDVHKEWVENICGELGIAAWEPLWNIPTEDVIAEFLSAGYSAVIITADARLIEAKWLGRRVDEEFLAYLRQRNLDVCGEKGEYHTLVVDGPLFAKRIVMSGAHTVQRGDYHFLDVTSFGLVGK